MRTARLGIALIAGAVAAIAPGAGHSAQQPETDTPAAPLERVIVTARRVEEDRLDVPLRVDVLPGEFLDATDPANLYELQFDVPGLVVAKQGMFGAGLALRGITDEGGGTLAVAPHLDGVYLGQSMLALTRMFDIDRIEVLKGPQGTLYGRNSTGGSINVFTRSPTDQRSAAIEVARASFNTTRLEGHLNLPAERLAFRLAFAGSEGDGFIRNSIDTRRFAADNFAGLRASVVAEPTDRLSLRIAAQQVRDEGGLGELWSPRKDSFVDPADIRLTTVTLADPYLTTSDDHVSGTVEADLGFGVLRATSGYARDRTKALDDCAGWPALTGCVRGLLPAAYEQRSQELQLASDRNARFEWLAGAYWLDADEFRHFYFRLATPTAINDYESNREEAAHALFGEASFPIGQRWNLTSGARITREENNVTFRGNGVADSPEPLAGEDSWRETSWRTSMKYSLGDNAMAFASVATGFKSGGITTELLPTGELDRYDPENLTAYETGLNLRLPQRRLELSVSAFWYDFRNLQVRTTAVLAGSVTSVVDNAARARVRGIDFSTDIRFGESLTLSAAFVVIPTRKFVEFADATGSSSLAGNVLSRAPELSSTVSVTHAWRTRRAGGFLARAELSYRSEMFFTKENLPIYSQESFGLLNLFVEWSRTGSPWYVFGSARNVLDQDYFDQAFFQTSPGYPVNYEIGWGRRFDSAP